MNVVMLCIVVPPAGPGIAFVKAQAFHEVAGDSGPALGVQRLPRGESKGRMPDRALNVRTQLTQDTELLGK